MKIQLLHKFDDIISVENLLTAWQEFARGKRGKLDVQRFSLNLMDNIIQLHQELENKSYRHGGYYAFKINDPKPRQIHKASVRDRLAHHAIYRILYPFFDKKFIADSFSCRLNRGTHRALNRFRTFGYKVSKNNTKTCWILKCDIKKFFASIDHEILIDILREYTSDADILWLSENVVNSFKTSLGIGLPLGNLTSQLFCNIYMNKLDRFVKYKLSVKHYIRYADDFVIFSENKDWLEKLIFNIEEFLRQTLKLELHPNKVFIKTLASGVDFLGWVHFPDHRVLRTASKKRMLRRIKENHKEESLQSYLGLLKHGNTKRLKEKVLDYKI